MMQSSSQSNSLAVFRSFIRRRRRHGSIVSPPPDYDYDDDDRSLPCSPGSDAESSSSSSSLYYLDASEVVSRACFLTWLGLRRTRETETDARRFQRTLSNHLSAVDGRSPFSAEEEAAVLLVVRRKVRWPCFPPPLNIGHTGYRSKGFHEKSFNHFKQPIAGLSAGKFQDKEFILNFAQTVRDMVNTNINTTTSSSSSSDLLSVYAQVGSLTRFVVLARTPACSIAPATPEQLHALLAHHTRQHPADQAIVLMDLTAKDYAQGLVLAQNEHTGRVFGQLGKRLSEVVPFHPGDMFKVALAVCSAFHQPGVSFCAPGVRYQGVEGEEVCMDGHYVVDEASFVLVFRAVHPLTPASRSRRLVKMECTTMSPSSQTI